MAVISSRTWTLASRPDGMPTHDNFALITTEAAEPAEGEIQVRNQWLSVDPYMRGRMNDRKSYVPPFQLGEPMTGGAVGVVTASAHPDFAVGDAVMSMCGWREAWTAAPETVRGRAVDPALPLSAYLGVAGMPGRTAYIGLLRIAALREGDTVFVSGAAGAVGSVVVQIAHLKGCTVIGSAGGPAKGEYVRSLGASAVIDYKAVDGYAGLLGALREAAPKGIDVYFDNVGGDHLQAAIAAARPHGRMAICGMIDGYNATSSRPGPNNMVQIVGKELQLRGFIVSSHNDMARDFHRDIAEWLGSGAVQHRETVVEGIERMPEAFLGLFTGANIGKMVVSCG